MYDFAAQDTTDGTRIRIVAIGRHALRLVTNRLDGLLEKGRGCCQIAGRAEHRINQIAVAVDGPVQVMPRPIDLDVGFVHIPRFARLSAPFGFQLLAQLWRTVLCWTVWTSVRIRRFQGKKRAKLKEKREQFGQTIGAGQADGEDAVLKRTWLVGTNGRLADRFYR